MPLRYCARQIACLSAPSLYGWPRSKWTPLLFPFPISQWTRQYPIYPASSCSQLFQTRSEAYRRLSSTRHARRFRTCQEPEGPGFQSSLPRRLNLKTAGLQKGPQRSFQSVMASLETVASYRPPFRLSPTPTPAMRNLPLQTAATDALLLLPRLADILKGLIACLGIAKARLQG